MRRARRSLAWGLAAMVALAAPARAEDSTVVHIACDTGAEGSGVIVSAEGHVLTAAHVMAPGATCTASIGRRNGPRLPLVAERRHPTLDALLMRLDAGAELGPLPFATVCPLEGQGGQEIRVVAFHGASTGAPSVTEGILSTTELRDGTVEMTGMTAEGKSGGPVFLHGTDAIVGIVAGAEFAASGLVAYYGMVPVEGMADFGLTPARVCEAEAASVQRKLGEIEAQSTWEARLDPAGRIEIVNRRLVPSAPAPDAILVETRLYQRVVQLDGSIRESPPFQRDPVRTIPATINRPTTSTFVADIGLAERIPLIADFARLGVSFHVDPDHGISRISIRITPVLDGAEGDPVMLELPVSAAEWAVLYERFR